MSENYDLSQIKQLKLNIEALRLQRNSIIAQNHAMQAELVALIKNIKKKNAEFINIKTECDWLEEKIAKLKPEYDEIKSKKDFMVGELRYLEPNVSDSKEIHAILKTKNNHLQGEVSLFESQIRILKDKIRQAKLQDKGVMVE